MADSADALNRRVKRLLIGGRRIQNILRTSVVANDRMLEQKISDAGPGPQRIDPHLLTLARQSLVKRGVVAVIERSGLPWFHLTSVDPSIVERRLDELDNIHRQTQKFRFTNLLGQTLEIAVFRALATQATLHYFGAFNDLDAHDDSTPYGKTEPPSHLSGRTIAPRRLDFLVHLPSAGYAGVEVKNIRQWMYPNRDEMKAFLLKCCQLDVIPVLIARRIHYSTFSVLNPCGVLIHQTFNQLFPQSAAPLAALVRNKDLLGFHDVRLGNQPDSRLVRFVHDNLPRLLRAARTKFDRFKDLLAAYAAGDQPYKSFAARVRRRTRAEPEDLPPLEPEAEEDIEGLE